MAARRLARAPMGLAAPGLHPRAPRAYRARRAAPADDLLPAEAREKRVSVRALPGLARRAVADQARGARLLQPGARRAIQSARATHLRRTHAAIQRAQCGGRLGN